MSKPPPPLQYDPPCVWGSR